MVSLTYNNYFTTSGTGKDWSINFKKCTKKIIEDYHKELINAAHIIHEQADSKLVLLFSGGLDGEFMLNIFRTAKIPFDTAIISYGKYNAHDTEYAFSYCNDHNIKPIIVDIDIEDFIKSGKLLDIATKANCNAYQMPSIMYGLSKLEGTLVMANGEPYIKNYDGVWKYQETEHVNSYMKWYTDNSIDGTPDFLRYTPETTVAFIKEPRVQELVANKHPGKLSTRTSKHLIYSKNYTFVPRPKYTGWELLEKTPFFENEVLKEFERLKDKNNGVYEIESKKLLELLCS
jgi:hypothetical protein